MLHGDERTQLNDPAALPSMVGRVLYERFLVEGDLSDRTLGTGFSCWLVKDLKNFCDEAVFKIASAAPSPVAGGPSFQQVCDVLIRVGHPNIEEMLESGMLFDGRPYAVARAHTGRRLSEILSSDGRLELDRAASVIEQVAEALAAAHGRNVLHCDVRPSNVAVMGEGTVSESYRLINFGSAWPVDVRGESLENLSPESESLNYAAPELHSKLGHRTNATDIYSLSALAYRLLTGRVPFIGADRASLLQAIGTGHVLSPTDLRTDLTNEAENLILSGLRFEPAWRPQDVEDFGIRLARSLRPSRRFFALEVPAAKEPAVEREIPIRPAIEPIEETAEGDRELRRVFKNERPAAAAVSDRTVASALMVLLLAGALSIPIAQTLLAGETPGSAPETALQKTSAKGTRVELRYWLESLRLGQNRTDQASPAITSGELNYIADKPGSLLIIGESVDTEQRVKYRLVYPLGRQAESEVIGKAVRTGTVLSSAYGAERLWMIWLPPASRELEEVRKATGPDGSISDEAARKVRHFLERNREMGVAERKDGVTGHTILTGSGDRIVHRIDQASDGEK